MDVLIEGTTQHNTTYVLSCNRKISFSAPMVMVMMMMRSQRRGGSVKTSQGMIQRFGSAEKSRQERHETFMNYKSSFLINKM